LEDVEQQIAHFGDRARLDGVQDQKNGCDNQTGQRGKKETAADSAFFRRLARRFRVSRGDRVVDGSPLTRSSRKVFSGKFPTVPSASNVTAGTLT
jgi:hypothetical protein